MPFTWAISDGCEVNEYVYATGNDRSGNPPSTSGRGNVHFCVSHVTVQHSRNVKCCRLKRNGLKRTPLPPLASLSISVKASKGTPAALLEVEPTKSRSFKEFIRKDQYQEEKRYFVPAFPANVYNSCEGGARGAILLAMSKSMLLSIINIKSHHLFPFLPMHPFLAV